MTKRRLTIKQRTFVKKYLENGGNGTQAALEAYDTNDYNTAHVIASENLQNLTIQEQIEGALRSRGLSADTFMGNINELASVEVEKVSADVKLKANIEILKLIGAYPDKKTVVTNINLKGKLDSLPFKDLTSYKGEIISHKNKLSEDLD